LIPIAIGTDIKKSNNIEFRKIINFRTIHTLNKLYIRLDRGYKIYNCNMVYENVLTALQYVQLVFVKLHGHVAVGAK